MTMILSIAGLCEAVLSAALLVVGSIWCRWFHSRDLLPFCGRVRCATCHRERPSPWR